MTTGVRSFNPIWSEVNLTGDLFDDSYYLYVLQNEIPYIPAPVYHDDSLTIPWSNPIQFLANGTLPVDVFWLTDQVYRLEFRKNNGMQPPSQSDELIYLVQNYKPGSGGITPPTSLTLTTENQITNPQFALYNYPEDEEEYTVTGATDIEIGVAPGWVLELAGTGNVTIQRVAYNDDTQTDTNAPYALRINNTSWSSVILRQRFAQNGMLWTQKTVSNAFTARVQGASVTLTSSLWDSNGTPLTPSPLISAALSSNLEQYTGYQFILETTNPNVPPAAYIDYRLNIPPNSDVFVTSFQIVVSDEGVNLPFSYEQDTVNRQIDHTYNTAYPIVPVGTVIDYGGFTIPDHYFLCDGAAKSRLDYNQLFRAVTFVEEVTLTNTVATFTVASSTDLWIGMRVEGEGVAASTTISNISGTTITMSNAATATVTSDVRFFAYGAADTDTFNLPDLRDYVIAGVGGSLFGATNNGVGKLGGAASHQITVNELPEHTHNATQGAASGVGGTNRLVSNPTGTGAFTGVNTTTHTAMSLVQQTALMKKLIRYE